MHQFSSKHALISNTGRKKVPGNYKQGNYITNEQQQVRWFIYNLIDAQCNFSQ